MSSRIASSSAARAAFSFSARVRVSASMTSVRVFFETWTLGLETLRCSVTIPLSSLNRLPERGSFPSGDGPDLGLSGAAALRFRGETGREMRRLFPLVRRCLGPWIVEASSDGGRGAFVARLGRPWGSEFWQSAWWGHYSLQHLCFCAPRSKSGPPGGGVRRADGGRRTGRRDRCLATHPTPFLLPCSSGRRATYICYHTEPLVGKYAGQTPYARRTIGRWAEGTIDSGRGSPDTSP